MDHNFCDNIKTCRLVATEVVVPDKKIKEQYLDSWCRQDKAVWLNCKRYETKKSLGFCPDFVVPDTQLSVEEIIDKFDENQSN
jgi:hypothetical protein